ncbi:MAG: gamma-glutamyltransferase [Erysipelotrichaceae bacterium]|nr:gamma-glutamyltransferase [Erysipelotrichaceae bacterium]
MNPQEALDAPRFQWVGGKKIQFEHGIADSIAKELLRKGHDIEIVTENRNMGRGQIIWTDGTVLIGGTESRADGCIAAW